MPYIPIVDISALVQGRPGREAVASGIDRACREHGFFYVTGHGVDGALQQDLEKHSRAFFDQDLERKLTIRMERGGKAWRGYFPVGGELTSGRPDGKEGLYFGIELGPEHPDVRAGRPLHGPNLFPELAGFRSTVLAYMNAMTELGHRLVEGVALGLGLEASYFQEHCTACPFTLFRIFHYPPAESAESGDVWGVGEHTDYGLLTILRQDDVGGLEVKSPAGWVAAPPVPGAFLCNIGDMLERMTGGLYRSTLHRVRSPGKRGRLSFPFFFDPGFDAVVRPIDLGRTTGDDGGENGGGDGRWDGASVHAFEGTYGDYLLGKVARVFPGLGRDVF